MSLARKPVSQIPSNSGASSLISAGASSSIAPSTSLLQSQQQQDKQAVEALAKENRELKAKLESLERDNRGLRKAVFDLSIKVDMLTERDRRTGKAAAAAASAVFDIDTVLEPPQAQAAALASSQPQPSQSQRGVSNSPQMQQYSQGRDPQAAAAHAGGASVHAAANAHGTAAGLDLGSAPNSQSGTPKATAQPYALAAADDASTAQASSSLASSSSSYPLQQQPAVHHTAVATGINSQSGGGMRDSVTTVRDRLRDGRHFAYKHELKGHTAAVYAVQYSPDGKVLASGSLDKTVRVWDSLLQRQLALFEGHRTNVADLCWTNDSTMLASASYDQSVKLWDVNGSKHVSTHEVAGCAMTVKVDPTNNNIMYVGTSRNMIYRIDRRQAEPASKFATVEGMVNALVVFRDGEYIMSGDSQGSLKTWDVRNARVYASVLNDETRKAISHIHMSYRKTESDEEEERYLAVNSYDNVLRVYNRGSMPPKTPLSLQHAVKGHANKNWPIKSSFFHGIYHRTAQSQSSATDDLSDVLESNAALEDTKNKERSVHSTLLLATGSADVAAYIFDVGGPAGSHELIQKLEGHSDRVYAVNFHPMDPILATASADTTIRIWTARSTRPQMDLS